MKAVLYSDIDVYLIFTYPNDFMTVNYNLTFTKGSPEGSSVSRSLGIIDSNFVYFKNSHFLEHLNPLLQAFYTSKLRFPLTQ